MYILKESKKHGHNALKWFSRIKGFTSVFELALYVKAK